MENSCGISISNLSGDKICDQHAVVCLACKILISHFPADLVEFEGVNDLRCFEILLNFLFATCLFNEDFVVGKTITGFLIHSISAVIHLQEKALRVHVEMLQHVLIPLQVCENDIEDLPHKRLRGIEAD